MPHGYGCFNGSQPFKDHVPTSHISPRTSLSLPKRMSFKRHSNAIQTPFKERSKNPIPPSNVSKDAVTLTPFYSQLIDFY